MPLHPLLMRITVATCRSGNMPVATMIPSSNGLDDVMHARCYTFLGRTDKDIFLTTHYPFIHSYPHAAHQHLS
jgi:hypothetical protein